MKLVLPKTSKVYDIKENRRGDKLLTIIIDPFLGRNTSLDLTGKSIGYGIYYSVKHSARAQTKCPCSLKM